MYSKEITLPFVVKFIALILMLEKDDVKEVDSEFSEVSSNKDSEVSSKSIKSKFLGILKHEVSFKKTKESERGVLYFEIDI